MVVPQLTSAVCVAISTHHDGTDQQPRANYQPRGPKAGQQHPYLVKISIYVNMNACWWIDWQVLPPSELAESILTPTRYDTAILRAFKRYCITSVYITHYCLRTDCSRSKCSNGVRICDTQYGIDIGNVFAYTFPHDHAWTLFRHHTTDYLRRIAYLIGAN